MLNRFVKFIVVLGLAISIINPALVYAQATPATVTKPPSQPPPELPVYNAGVDKSIRDYVCAPAEKSDGKDLVRCINRLYKFGVTVGALLLVFFVVYTGYLYIVGGQTGKEKAKGVLPNAIVGLVIFLGSYLLLYFINPSLVQFKPIQPPIFSASILPSCEDLGFGADCIIATPGGGGQGSYGGSGNGSIVEIALREVGNGEPTNNNRGPNIDKYFKGCSAGPGNYWCACFATWVYRQAGLGKTMDAMPNTAGTLAINAWAKSKNGQSVPDGKIVWVSPDEALNGTPILPGDIVLWERGGANDSAGHTFIAVGYDPSTKTIASVEGNVSGDKVKKLNDKVIKRGDFLGAMRIVK